VILVGSRLLRRIKRIDHIFPWQVAIGCFPGGFPFQMQSFKTYIKWWLRAERVLSSSQNGRHKSGIFILGTVQGRIDLSVIIPYFIISIDYLPRSHGHAGRSILVDLVLDFRSRPLAAVYDFVISLADIKLGIVSRLVVPPLGQAVIILVTVYFPINLGSNIIHLFGLYPGQGITIHSAKGRVAAGAGRNA